MKIMRKTIIILMVLMAVSCDKVDDISLNGQSYSQRYPVQRCADNMHFNKNTVTMTYSDCWENRGSFMVSVSEYTHNYTYKNGVLVIDGLEVLSTSIGYEKPDKIIIKRDNEVGYVEFHSID